MARQRPGSVIEQTIVLACGATDADNLVDAVVPSPNATLLQVSATQKVAGVGTGTFSIQVKQGEATPAAIGQASGGTFIDADAVAGTVHGQLVVRAGTVRDAESKHLNISTVKTGVVTGNATIIFMLLWQL